MTLFGFRYELLIMRTNWSMSLLLWFSWCVFPDFPKLKLFFFRIYYPIILKLQVFKIHGYVVIVRQRCSYWKTWGDGTKMNVYLSFEILIIFYLMVSSKWPIVSFYYFVNFFFMNLIYSTSDIYELNMLPRIVVLRIVMNGIKLRSEIHVVCY